MKTIFHLQIKIEDEKANATAARSLLHCKLLRCGTSVCKFVEGYLTAECTKTRESPAGCANCGESHTANYGGCKCYRGGLK
ncbi:hypothetical protein Zmor_012100 [Zophobas morio]|uniref:Uncharacterized protein n=1 Tax=Zophobas morio TaxID=2755281 RepID=A0AA38HHJ5_9CUCU|nr:hypothetical protein Zmor_012100 [Zophobas morio]